jgi:hypothetical protein
MKKLLLSLFTLTTVLFGTAFGQSPRLAVELRTDKRSYKLSDVVSFEVLLTNRSRAPIYLYSDLDWGESASLSIWLKDAVSGKDVPEDEFIFDAITPPPRSKDDFVKVLPDHVYGVVIEVTVHDLSVKKKGIYEVVAYYHSPVPREMSFGLPVWSIEDGMLVSNRVRITIGD